MTLQSCQGTAHGHVQAATDFRPSGTSGRGSTSEVRFRREADDVETAVATDVMALRS